MGHKFLPVNRLDRPGGIGLLFKNYLDIKELDKGHYDHGQRTMIQIWNMET